MSFRDELRHDAEATERRIAKILSEKGELGAEMLDRAIAYSLQNGGKRLRAFLVLEFAKLSGVDKHKAIDYAAAIEMIQAFSLIHDDLPAMDDDDMRRGKPSNHKVFGEATAILAGDSLALDAFYTAGSNAECTVGQNLDACLLISRKSGSVGMCAGQQHDLDGEGRHIDFDELLRLVDLKTGALFSCACELGCIAANTNDSRRDAAEKFGLLTGRAFQITDDLLDLTGTSEELGKTAGKDELQQKSTFPSLLGTDGASEFANKCISDAKLALSQFDDCEAKDVLTEFCDFILVRSK